MDPLKPGDLCAWSVPVMRQERPDSEPTLNYRTQVGTVMSVQRDSVGVQERGGPLRYMELRSVRKIDRIPPEHYDR